MNTTAAFCLCCRSVLYKNFLLRHVMIALWCFLEPYWLVAISFAFSAWAKVCLPSILLLIWNSGSISWMVLNLSTWVWCISFRNSTSVIVCHASGENPRCIRTAQSNVLMEFSSGFIAHHLKWANDGDEGSDPVHSFWDFPLITFSSRDMWNGTGPNAQIESGIAKAPINSVAYGSVPAVLSKQPLMTSWATCVLVI